MENELHRKSRHARRDMGHPAICFRETGKIIREIRQADSGSRPAAETNRPATGGNQAADAGHRPAPEENGRVV